MPGRRPVIGVPLAAAVLLAACGSGDRASRPAGATATPAAAPLLVEFQRQGRAVATFDKLRLHADGSGEIDRRYGGAGRRITKIRVTAPVVREVRAALRRLPDRPRSAGKPAPGGRGFLYFVNWDGQSATAATGAIAPELRPLVRRLDAVIDGEGRQE